MRRLKCFSLVLSSGVLSLLLPCILLVSNTSAVSYNVNLSEVKTFNVSWKGQTRLQGQSWVESNFPVNIPTWSNDIDILTKTREVGAVWTRNTYPVKKGNYYEILFEIRSQPNANEVREQIMPLGYWENFVSNTEFEFISIEEILDYTDPALTRRCETSADNPGVCVSDGVMVYMPTYFWQSKWYKILLRARNDGDKYIQFGAKDQPTFVVPPARSEYQIPIRFRTLGVVVEYQASDAAEELRKQNEKDDQDRSDIESQSSNIDSSGESSQQSAENTGTTLLAAFSSFVTAITSASPSNCNIDMDLGNLDLGVVNFCTLAPPPEFQVLGSIFLILFCVPLSIATARKVISLFRSFQG